MHNWNYDTIWSEFWREILPVEKFDGKSNTLEVELPGFEPDDIKLEYDTGKSTLSLHAKNANREVNRTWRYTLVGQITSSLKNGILTINFGSEAPKAEKINIPVK